MKQQSKKDKIKAKNNASQDVSEAKHTPKSGEPLQELPTIDSLLTIAPENRQKKVQELFSQVKPFLKNYIIKKQGSRVVQLMFKWGTQEIRNLIHQCLSKNWKDMLKSKYAVYLIAKVAREKDYPMDKVVEECVMLQQNRQTAQILENYIKRNVEDESVKKIRNSFIQLSEKAVQGDNRSQEILQNTAIKIIEKQYHSNIVSKVLLRVSLKHLFEEEREKVLDYLIEHIAEIVNDEDGVRLFIEIMNYSSSKQKKAIVKLYKGYISEIINNNNVSYVSIIKLMTQVDDTVLIGKSIVGQLGSEIPRMVQCKKVFSILFSLFSPRNHNYNIIGKFQPTVTVTQCKKTEEQRKSQLRGYIYEFIMENLKGQLLVEVLKSPNEGKLIIGIVKSMLEDNFQSKNQFISSVVNLYTSQLTKQQKNSEMDFNNLLISHPLANKILKNILSIHDQVFDSHCDKVSEVLLKNIQRVLKSKASFVLLGLIQKGGRDQLLDAVRKSGIKIETVVAAEHYAKLLRDQNQNQNQKKTQRH